MTDAVLSALVRLVDHRRDHAVPAGTDAAIRDRVADSMLLAAGSWDEGAVVPVRRYADDSGSGGSCHAWGSSARYRAYEAALLNGTAARVLDFNDAFFGLDSSHPSDVIPAMFAVAEDRGASLAELVRAIDVAYSAIIAFADHVKSRAVGWDHAMTTGLGACCGIGQLLGLDDEQLGNAVAILCTSSMTGRQTRASTLTSWKAIAAPFSAARAIEACRLARFGAVGPLEPFLGPHGYLTSACRGTFDRAGLLAALDPAADRVVERTHLKLWPVGYLAHSALDAARVLHERRRGRGLQRVRILTVDAAAEIMDAPDKRWPQTRETADHSLAYSVVAVLELGAISPSVFDQEQIATNRIRERVRDCVEIEATDAFNARYPSEQPARVEIEYDDGTHDAEEVACAHGHANRPAGLTELNLKFERLFEGRTVFSPLRSALADAAMVEDVIESFEQIVEPLRRPS